MLFNALGLYALRRRSNAGGVPDVMSQSDGARHAMRARLSSVTGASSRRASTCSTLPPSSEDTIGAAASSHSHPMTTSHTLTCSQGSTISAAHHQMRKTVVAITLTIHPSVVGQPHGRTILGPKKNILSIKRDDLAPAASHTKTNYTADCMVIVSVSSVDDGEIFKVANPAWLHGSPKTRWKNGKTMIMVLSPYWRCCDL